MSIQIILWNARRTIIRLYRGFLRTPPMMFLRNHTFRITESWRERRSVNTARKLAALQYGEFLKEIAKVEPSIFDHIDAEKYNACRHKLTKRFNAPPATRYKNEIPRYTGVMNLRAKKQ